MQLFRRRLLPVLAAPAGAASLARANATPRGFSYAQ